MRIYFSIDGTDNSDPSAAPNRCMPGEALLDLAGGHVKRMGYRGFDVQGYLEGTQDSITGASSASKIDQAVAWVTERYGERADSSRKLFLGGFSRGAAAIIVIAHKLQAKGIPVQEMYLFDAVDRSFWMNDAETKIIPGNVTKAFHALRSPQSGSRRTFGNCGLVGTNNNLVKDHFLTTHGGVGGWPNGAATVQPGVGAEDFAYFAQARAEVAREPFHPVDLLPGVNTGRAAARAMERIENDPRQNNIHEKAEPYPTNLTPVEERAGMAKAWQWMYSKAFSTLDSRYTS